MFKVALLWSPVNSRKALVLSETPGNPSVPRALRSRGPDALPGQLAGHTAPQTSPQTCGIQICVPPPPPGAGALHEECHPRKPLVQKGHADGFLPPRSDQRALGTTSVSRCRGGNRSGGGDAGWPDPMEPGHTGFSLPRAACLPCNLDTRAGVSSNRLPPVPNPSPARDAQGGSGPRPPALAPTPCILTTPQSCIKHPQKPLTPHAFSMKLGPS